MNRAMWLVLVPAAGAFALLLSSPSSSLGLDAGPLEEPCDAGAETLFDGGVDPLLDGGPEPLPLPDEEPYPVPPAAL